MLLHSLNSKKLWINKGFSHKTEFIFQTRIGKNIFIKLNKVSKLYPQKYFTLNLKQIILKDINVF